MSQRMAILKDNVVVNVIIADSSFCAMLIANGEIDNYVEDTDGTANIGQVLVEGVLVNPS